MEPSGHESGVPQAGRHFNSHCWGRDTCWQTWVMLQTIRTRFHVSASVQCLFQTDIKCYIWSCVTLIFTCSGSLFFLWIEKLLGVCKHCIAVWSHRGQSRLWGEEPGVIWQPERVKWKCIVKVIYSPFPSSKLQGPVLLGMVEDAGRGTLGSERKPDCCQQVFLCKHFW